MLISTHTLRGERDMPTIEPFHVYTIISTHTLRGERDIQANSDNTVAITFQLTRSVGSVTTIPFAAVSAAKISTHTLRGERDTLSWQMS